MHEWEQVSLGSVAKLQKGLAYGTDNLVDRQDGRPFITLKCFAKGGGFRIAGLKGFAGLAAEHSQVRGGDLLIANTDLTRDGEVVGAPALVPAELDDLSPLISMDVSVLRADNTKVHTGFLAHLLAAAPARKFMKENSAGSTVLHLNTARVPKLRISLPPIREQCRIAEVLDSVDASIHTTERLIAKGRDLYDSILYRTFEEPTTRVCGYAEPLGRLADIAGGVPLGRSLPSGITIELPYLRVANVQDGYIDTTDIKKVRVLVSELPRFSLESGDVLMTEGGDFDKLGRGAVWDGSIAPCLHQNHIFRVRTNRSRLFPAYLAAYSRSHQGRRYFVGASKQTTNLASINMTQLKAFPVQVPSLETQRYIVDLISTHTRTLEAQELELCNLLALKRGLMDDLLTGRVRVNAGEGVAA